MRTGIAPVLFFLLAFAPRSLAAQFNTRTWLPWRTIETQRFVFHYPAELEAWTRHVAERADAIGSAVAQLVGSSPSRRTHVIVDDPYQLSNGAAWPFLDRPMISLWAMPPTPRDDIGEYHAWDETLFAHEFAHIAHLTRPTRNPRLAALISALPIRVGPLALRTPRWAFEGYATFVEGRLTGSGRPHAAWRAAILRQWAIEGQFPRYEYLNATGGYEVGSFAYLVGSAFFEWLVARHGDSSLVHVWRRLSARQNRTFDAAFAGVFGESPAALYGRFSADVVAKSIDVARLVASPDTGAIVQRLTRNTGDPSISHDGRRVALVIRSPVAPSRVVVWRTAPEPDTLRQRRDSLLLRADPEDVPARPIYPPPKRALATLRTRGGAPYESPRFLRDGRILVWRNTPRGDGSTVADLYLWNPERGSVQRVTSNASIFDADPLPDNRSAVATRCRTGWCDLVRVQFENGEVTTLLSGTADRSCFRPRVSPDGTTALVSVHQNGRWRLATVDIATREMTVVDPADGANRYDAAWLSAHEVVATSDRGGIANLERLNLRTHDARQLTSVTGAAVAAEPNPADSSIWFLSLYSRGYDVRRLPVSAVADARLPASPDPKLVPALSPRPTPGIRFGENAVSDPRPFGLWPRTLRWIPQPSIDADGASGGISLVSRDVIGRSELSATFAYGDASSWRGASLLGLWLGSRPGVRLHVFAAAQDLSATRSPLVPRFDVAVQLTGGEAALEGSLQYTTWGARYRGGASAASVRSSSSRALGFVDGGLAVTQRGDAWSVTESVSGSFTRGRSFAEPFSRGVVTAGLSAGGRALFPLALSALYGRTNGDAPLFEQFTLGGGPSLLIDRALLTQRITMPALPSGIRIGTSVFVYRASLALPLVSAYYWSGSTTPVGDRFDRWQRVVGLEWGMSIPPITGAGTPAARALVGVGESLDAPFRRAVRGYVSLVINP